MKHIPSGYQVNFSHDLQAERNEQFTSHSYLFYAGWGKMPLFCNHIIIKTTLNFIFHNNLQPYTNKDGDECGILF